MKKASTDRKLTYEELFAENELLRKKNRKLAENLKKNEMINDILKRLSGISFDYNLTKGYFALTVIDSKGNPVTTEYEKPLVFLQSTDIVAAEDKKSVASVLRHAATIPSRGALDFCAKFTGDEYRWYRGSYTSAATKKGAIDHVFGRVEDITKEKEYHRMAKHDIVTGLRNRASCEAVVNVALRMYPVKGAMLIIDADNFKHVNDVYGHDMGDKTLKMIGDGLVASFRDTDIIGRLGGDEFIVWLNGIDDSDEMLKRKLADVNEYIKKASRELGVDPLSLSAGATYAHDGDTFLVLYRRADLALYEAKANGKHCCVIYKEF